MKTERISFSDAEMAQFEADCQAGYTQLGERRAEIVDQDSYFKHINGDKTKFLAFLLWRYAKTGSVFDTVDEVCDGLVAP